MAEEDAMVSLMRSLNESVKTLDESVKTLKNDNKVILDRLEALEAPPQGHTGSLKEPVSSIRIRESQSRDIFEASSELSGNDSEVDIEAHSISFNTKTGPKIGNKLADTLNHDLVSQDDGTQIMKLREDYVRPENLPNLTVPKMNEEITPSDFVLHKEQNLCNIQQGINTAIAVLTDVLNDQSKVKHKYNRHDIFNKTNDAVSMLMHTHKTVTLARKMNIKHMLQNNIQHLCTKKHVKDVNRKSNNELFEEDLSNEIDRSFRNKKVTNKVTKNFRSGAPQGTPQFRFGQNHRTSSRDRVALRGGVSRRSRGRIQSRGRGQRQNLSR